MRTKVMGGEDVILLIFEVMGSIDEKVDGCMVCL